MKEFDMAKYTCLEDDCGIKPSKRMRCASCKRHIWKTSTSLPEGEATCRQCRRGNRRRNTDNTCIECGRSWTGRNRPAVVCGTCAKKKTEAARAQDGKLCQIPGCDRGAYSLTRMLCGSHAASDSSNKRQMQNTCRGCGQTFTSRDKQLYCSIQCFNRNKPAEDYTKAAATRAERSYSYECRVCGCQGTGGPGRTVCDETLCKYLARGGQPTCDLTRIQCINCANHCYLQYSTQSTCLDPICIYAVTRGSNYSNIYIKTCEWCETSFTTTQPGSVYCSAQCRKRRNNAHSGHNPRPWKRWAKLVYERDNYTCHICNKPTLREWDENNRNMSPSLDHIIPKSLGGPHTPENLRCCHMLCNALRGTDPIDSAEAGNLILE